jgi:5-methylcytosine-specific restriction endonuclease McrA
VPITAASVELTRFDTQKLQDPEIRGIGYQQGELPGYEVRQYLLEKFDHTCAYCGGRSGDPVLEVEHIVPLKRGGSNRVSNLTIACRECNQKKGDRTAEEFGHPEVQAQARQPLKNAAAVNTTRWTLYRTLSAQGFPVEVGTGGRTKYNRTRLGLPKARWTDAACIGASGADVFVPPTLVPPAIWAMGHGKRQRCGTDRYGFPTRHALRAKRHMGFQTGDLVRASIPAGKYAGLHFGRVSIRHRPSFRLNGFDVPPKHLTILQRADGYEYGDGEPRQQMLLSSAKQLEGKRVSDDCAASPVENPELQ